MSTLKDYGLFQLSSFVGSVNSMVDQLSAFAFEVARVALEVGTQDILGVRARVEGVQGTLADLTRNVNVCCFILSFHFYIMMIFDRKWLRI
ncbi:hypothetical protein BYT27DRAFT_7325187 [Phlegmacium glaucopus]|nr:hypothetical protein BYT27DRAFT_7325187 [Phlegmacium glaucopus]